MTDAEIRVALECCITRGNCQGCPLWNERTTECLKIAITNALDLINRLQAENEELKSAINGFRGYEDKIKAEAYKEFADELARRFGYAFLSKHDWVLEVMENLLKELTEKTN